jgi:hypothetical protein
MSFSLVDGTGRRSRRLGRREALGSLIWEYDAMGEPPRSRLQRDRRFSEVLEIHTRSS